jgi:hypothetical protein
MSTKGPGIEIILVKGNCLVIYRKDFGMIPGHDECFYLCDNMAASPEDADTVIKRGEMPEAG